jgi:hypothetical protein
LFTGVLNKTSPAEITEHQMDNYSYHNNNDLVRTCKELFMACFKVSHWYDGTEENHKNLGEIKFPEIQTGDF